MPPQGLLLVAAYLPRDWEVRVVDENVRSVTDADVAWCDAVLKFVAVGGPRSRIWRSSRTT
jgi:hypothetical protein